MYVDFGAIVRRAFDIAWKYKSLWVFGLFAGGVGSFNFDWVDDIGRVDTDMEYAYTWLDKLQLPRDLLPESLSVYSAVILWIAALGLLFFVCYLIAQPAIIDAVNKLTRGGQYAWDTSFSRGADFFWRFLGLVMVQLVAGTAVLAAMILPAIVLSPWILFLTVPIGIVLFFFVYHTFTLAEVAMVARDSAIADAVIEGWNLLLQNKANCFLLTLIMIGLGLCFAIVLGVVALVLYLPVNLLVLALTDNLVAILMLALFIGLPVALCVGGYTGTFFNALYVQFYFRLVEPRPAAMPQPMRMG